MNKNEIEQFLLTIERKAKHIDLNYDDKIVVRQDAETIEDVVERIRILLYE